MTLLIGRCKRIFMNCTRHFACNQIQYNKCCNIEGSKIWKWYSVYYFYFIQENVKIICEIPRYSNGNLLRSFYNVVGATQFLCINKYTHANFRALFVKTNTWHENIIGTFMYLFAATICKRTWTVHDARTPH